LADIAEWAGGGDHFIGFIIIAVILLIAGALFSQLSMSSLPLNLTADDDEKGQDHG